MAVYTEVTDDALDAFLADYALGAALSCKGIAEGVENSNFLLHTETGFYILTLFEKRVHAEDLPFFLGLMSHLAAAGFPCPEPVPARDGEALRHLAGRPATIVSFLDGVWVKRPQAAHCRQLGEAMARMHGQADGFSLTRTNALAQPHWRPLFAASASRADSVAPGLGSLIEAELDHLDAAWPADLPVGIVHADLFPDNVFFIRNVFSGFIDFYFACNDMLSYDLAIALNAWCFETDGQLNVTKAMALLEGYQAVRPLTEAERRAMPILARGAAMRFLLTRLHDWLHHVEGSYVVPKDPKEYAMKLRFHQSVHGPEAYGLAGAP